MKILLTSKLDIGNPLIDELFNRLSVYTDIQISIDSFWAPNISESYDIIHIQWPEQLFNWEMISDNDVNRLANQLKYWKNKNSKIVVTRHNTQPHKLNDVYHDAYFTLYDLADSVIHFSNASVENFHTMYPENMHTVKHFVIPHPMYEDILNTSTREQAREALRIDQNSKVVLVFGSIRHESERDFTLKVFNKLNIKNKLLLAPSLLVWLPSKKSLFKRLLFKINMLLSRFKKSYHLQRVFISDDHIQDYMHTADVVFLPRFDVLNSGVLVMAYTFNKIVVGPKIGSIGEILTLSNNPSFEVGNVDDATKKLEQILMNDTEGFHNRQFAEDNMSWNLVISKHIDLYNQIMS